MIRLGKGHLYEGLVMDSLSRRNAVCLVLLAAAASIAAALPSPAAEKIPVAIKGYDPVAYFTDGKPVAGRPDLEYVWDEYRYRFASQEHRALFKADPVRYAPRFANFCAMALSEGEVEEANPEYWLISDGKLYLFGRPEGPKLFQRDISGNVFTAEQNRALIRKN
jgi:YHS domain-containing protein